MSLKGFFQAVDMAKRVFKRAWVWEGLIEERKEMEVSFGNCSSPLLSFAKDYLSQDAVPHFRVP